MKSKYLWRMDDITPDMDWNQFWKFLNLFKNYNVKPLLGIVPDNRDSKLSIQNRNPRFWEIMRSLQGQVDFAQHGYQHIYETRVEGILGGKYGFKAQSEFAGLPYEVQYEKIKKGKEILNKEGIFTDVWMAPSHSFDNTTLKVLKDLGFKAVTDGIGLFPFEMEGLTFVPQQLWRARFIPIGIITICLHVNHEDDKTYQAVENHLRSSVNYINFNDARNYKLPYWINSLFNVTFRFCVIVLRKLQKLNVTIPG